MVQKCRMTMIETVLESSCVPHSEKIYTLRWLFYTHFCEKVKTQHFLNIKHLENDKDFEGLSLLFCVLRAFLRLAPLLRFEML